MEVLTLRSGRANERPSKMMSMSADPGSPGTSTSSWSWRVKSTRHDDLSNSTPLRFLLALSLQDRRHHAFRIPGRPTPNHWPRQAHQVDGAHGAGRGGEVT